MLDCGYVPLVDCAPLIIARELGFAREEGIDLNLVAQPSWSALRDMLALGHLDAAQMLSPMPVAMSLGLGGLRAKVDAMMVLSVNGTVFGLSTVLAQKLPDAAALFGKAEALHNALKEYITGPVRVGVPFHLSMHRMLLEYWLGNISDVSLLDLEIVTVPPPRMADALQAGEVDAFWVGEPWGSVAVSRGVGQVILPGAAIWQCAPEKVLAARHDWIDENPDKARALMRAVHHAQRWLDRADNKPLAVEILARSAHLDLASDLIDPAIFGHITPAPNAAPIPVERFVYFHKAAAAFPWRSQAAWIAAQLGATGADIDAAKKCFRSDLFRDTLGPIGVDLPGASEKIEGTMHHATAVSSTRGHMILGPDAFFDGRVFENGQES